MMKQSSTQYYVSTQIFHHETTQYRHVEAGHKAPQRTHLPHVSRAAVFSQAARKLLPQILPSENSLINKTQGKQIQTTTTPCHYILHSQTLHYFVPPRQVRYRQLSTTAYGDGIVICDGIQLPWARSLQKFKCRNR